MKILVAIESCQRDRALQQAQRDTWLKDLRGADYRFFYGGSIQLDLLGQPYLPAPDEVHLDVEDSYAGLARKTQAICEWAIREGYDAMFKCDIDTVVNPWLFLLSVYWPITYAGAENADEVPCISGRINFASGGAGYWLGRAEMRCVVGSPIRTNAEDVFVADSLRQNQRYPIWVPTYKWRPGSEIDKDTVALHLSSALQKKYEPSQMYEAYEKMRSFR